MKSTTRTLILFLSLFFLVAGLGACYKLDFPKPIPGDPGQRPTKEISRNVADQLKVDDQLPAVVFSVDKNGAMQAYRVKGTKSEPMKFPLPTGFLQSMKTITIFQTSNPKTCWTNFLGDLQCVIW